MRSASELEFRPYCFVDAHGQPAGFGVDLLRAVAEKMGLRLRHTAGPWPELWHDLVAGELDVLPVVARTAGREPLVDFSLPHTQTYDAFFRRAGEPPLPDLAAAAGKEIIVLREDAAHHQLRERRFDGEIVLVDSIPDGLRQIAAGKHDAFLCSKVIGVLEQRQAGIRGVVAGPPIPDYERTFSFAVRKGNTELLEKLDQGLVLAKADGTYDRIYRRWLTVDDPWQRWLPYFRWSVAGLIVMGGLVVVLQALVRRRTRELRDVNATLERRVAQRTAELTASEGRLRDELYAKTKLQELGGKLIEQGELEPLLREILAASADLTGTDKGNVQIYDPRTGTLRILVHQGLGRRLVEHFADEGWVATCSEAAGTMQRVVVEDVAALSHLRGTPGLEIVLEDGTRAIQSTPLLSRDGRLLGMLNNHYRTPGRPDDDKLRIVDLLARQAADLIERTRAEQALRESEEVARRQADLIRAINDNTEELIFMKDTGGRLTYANAATLRIIGRTAETFSTLDRENFSVPEEHAPIHANDLRVIETGQTIRIEEPYTSPDGTRRVFLSNKTPLRDAQGEIVGVIGVSRDITERQRAEQALRESEARLRSVIEQLPAGVGLMDREGRWIITNAAMELYVPGGIPSTLPQRARRWQFVDERGRVIAPADWPGQRALRGETVLPGMEGLFTDDDGREIWMRVSAAPLRSESGEIAGATAIVQDIDLIKRAEQSLRDADRNKDQFLATLAHELRNPLAPIVTCVDLLDQVEDAPRVSVNALAVIRRQLKHLVRLVDDLLDVSRIARDKLELRSEPVELGAVIRGAMESWKLLAESFGHEVHVALPDEPMWLDADPVRLAQVIDNLFSNACKYTPPKGQVWVRAAREGNDAVIEVRDTGLGIPADALGSVFEMFSQLGHTVPRENGGLGIGLHLAKRLVEMHGGRVEARSAGEGKGAEFVVRLPLHDEAPAHAPPAPRDAADS